jgi:glycosyltransferase involved in cell wall biosynthesis
LIVVDASDDRSETAEVVARAASGHENLVVLIQAEPSSAAQRNVGLQLVNAPVVFMPDDDSLWHQGYAEAVMRVYERDVEEAIGAVGRRPSNRFPGNDDHSGTRLHYRRRFKDALVATLQTIRYRIERRYLTDPAWLASLELQADKKRPLWLTDVNAAPVEMISGYRMSFRTSVVKERGFDVVLGANIGYAAYEDAELCLHVAKTHLLTAALDAEVYHHRHPGKRADSERLGFFLNHNRAMIVCRHLQEGAESRASLKRFAWYKWAQYMSGMISREERERARGTLRSISVIDELRAATAEELDECYLRTIPRRYCSEKVKETGICG